MIIYKFKKHKQFSLTESNSYRIEDEACEKDYYLSIVCLGIVPRNRDKMY